MGQFGREAWGFAWGFFSGTLQGLEMGSPVPLAPAVFPEHTCTFQRGQFPKWTGSVPMAYNPWANFPLHSTPWLQDGWVKSLSQTAVRGSCHRLTSSAPHFSLSCLKYKPDPLSPVDRLASEQPRVQCVRCHLICSVLGWLPDGHETEKGG